MNQPSEAPSETRHHRWQKRRKNLRSPFLFISGVLAAFAALLVYNALVTDPPSLTRGEVDEAIAQAIASATPQPAFSAQVYEAILPSMVFIQVEATGTSGEPGQGLGSGVVINGRGDILTSLHVVEGASEIFLTFPDGTHATGEVVFEQPENDIAVLGTSQLPEQFRPAILGNPNAMRVGDEAFAVGHPLGLFGSMSAGVISGFDRSFHSPDGGQILEGLIQFDAAVNPGNSGGPLLNRYGQVVGIVTALANPTEQDVFIGIGFAVPIDVASAAAGLPPY